MFGFFAAAENKTQAVFLARTVGCGEGYAVQVNIEHIGLRKYISPTVWWCLKVLFCYVVFQGPL